MSKQIEPPTKPLLSSHQTAVDDDETGLKYSGGDETGMLDVSKLPHNLDEILKDADKQIDRSSNQKIYDQLSSGIYLKQKKQKFWVDKNLKNCFMLYAIDLQIMGGGYHDHWGWPTLKDEESSEASTFEAAELMGMYYLDVSGKFETFKLSPGTKYEVVFIVMIKNLSYGFDSPVNVKLQLQDKTIRVIRQHQEFLWEKQTEIWIEIPIGIFMTSPHPAGHVEFSMDLDDDDDEDKKGLVIKGVCIRPKMYP